MEFGLCELGRCLDASRQETGAPVNWSGLLGTWIERKQPKSQAWANITFVVL